MGAFANPLGNAPGLTPEPIQGNSLTQYLRSLTNYGGNTGSSLLSSGTGMTGQAADYWSGILSGNPTALASAMQPEITAASQQYNAARQQANTFAPSGGGRSSLMAQLPFQQAGTVSNIIAQARPQAAQQLANLGLGTAGLGGNLLGLTLNSILGERGQDMQQQNANMGFLTSGLSSLVGAGGQMGSAAIMGSDYRIKENIKRVGKLGPLNVYTFNFIGEKKRHIGFIAQEVHKIFPEAVLVGDGTQPWKVNYSAALALAGVY